MPKAIPQSELETIYGIVEELHAGASVEDIKQEMNIKSSRRTLQRRLALLVAQGRLVLEGRGRGSCYRIPSESDTSRSGVKKPIRRHEALAILSSLKPELSRRFGVTRLGLFGSTVHDKSGPESDVDIVVAFDGPATSKRYFGVQFLLEDALSHPVDLITEKAMRPELQPYIYKELVNV
ncbi:MAG: nucleotidyltransferase domain-containing protein [Xanthomonadales bacterium]